MDYMGLYRGYITDYVGLIGVIYIYIYMDSTG